MLMGTRAVGSVRRERHWNLCGRSFMGELRERRIQRRDLLRAMTVGVAAVALPLAPAGADAGTTAAKDKRRARYQANSVEVQNFYRVNRYPSH
jgi:hypothetical protein